MTAVFNDYLPILIVALVIGAITGFLLFRQRQRVRLSDSAPVRPHMAVEQRRPIADTFPIATKRPGPLDGAAAAFEDVSGTILNARVHSELAETADDLQRLKGVGPKFVTLLHSQGLFSFAQIAQLTENEVALIDATMGAFRGRFARDRIVAQADYLARGDADGYEQQFGKL
ncbi:hypothetical protein [Sphingomonas sp.]|uniref:hypothetical protein n=1 Tax=Sphingomonas sp. TaxID=28214 RepID=UPI00286B08F3|nr:hypothetical protein [Sphingomonas sp.]